MFGEALKFFGRVVDKKFVRHCSLDIVDKQVTVNLYVDNSRSFSRIKSGLASICSSLGLPGPIWDYSSIVKNPNPENEFDTLWSVEYIGYVGELFSIRLYYERK